MADHNFWINLWRWELAQKLFRHHVLEDFLWGFRSKKLSLEAKENAVNDNLKEAFELFSHYSIGLFFLFTLFQV